MRLHLIWFVEHLHVTFARKMHSLPSTVAIMLRSQTAHSGPPFSNPVILLNLLHAHCKPIQKHIQIKYILYCTKNMNKMKNLRFAAGTRFLLALHRKQDKKAGSKYSSRSHEFGCQYSSTSFFASNALTNDKKKIKISVS